MYPVKKVICTILIVFIFSGCSENKTVVVSGEKQEQEITYTKKQLQELKTASKVVYSLPSPTEMAFILHETDAMYDVAILNDPKALNQYYTDVSRALNLGVYFADLSFTSMFDYPQQAMLFMSAAQGISEELNIIGVFNEQLMSRLEENLANKDSIMEIVSFAYMETDAYLQENERSVIAKAILAGAWIEGLYIATNLKTASGSAEKIWQKIGAQQEALTNLINMIEDCNEPQLITFIEKVRKLESAFSEIKPLDQVLESDSSSVKGKHHLVISEPTAAAIDLETSNCRDHIVSVK